MFEYALVAGLTASGADAYLLHVTTTPSVSYVVRSEGFDCGIMISASHNPFYDNGIKIIDDKGHKMSAKVEALIEAYIDGETDEIPFAIKEKIGKTVDYSMGRNRYLGYLMSIPTRSFKDFKVGLDCANGASSAVAKSVFDALGAQTHVIHNTPDGTNINTNCGSTHIEVLQQYVKDNGLDIGFAYDGDADRCIAVDEFGRVVDGDLMLYVCGKYLKEHGELTSNTVVTTIMSNIGLYKAFDKEGIKYEKTAVGDKYVNENMVQNGYCLGGEQSGHVIFSKHATTGDGILTSLKVMEAVIESKKTLAQLIQPVTIYPQLMKNVAVRDKQEAQQDSDVQAIIKEIEGLLQDDGRVLVRESGTEPVVRVMVEADTDEKCAVYVKQIVDKMREKGYVIKR
jgi:phosphoglucosamine mutase